VLGGTLVTAVVGTETGMVRRGVVRVEGWAAGSGETWVYGCVDEESVLLFWSVARVIGSGGGAALVRPAGDPVGSAATVSPPPIRATAVAAAARRRFFFQRAICCRRAARPDAAGTAGPVWLGAPVAESKAAASQEPLVTAGAASRG
jgi:hypothetical protein